MQVSCCYNIAVKQLTDNGRRMPSDKKSSLESLALVSKKNNNNKKQKTF